VLGFVDFINVGNKAGVISNALGHSSIAITGRYLNHLHPQVVLDAVKKE